MKKLYGISKLVTAILLVAVTSSEADDTAVLLLHMDEAGWNGTPGEVVDSSSRGNDGTASGANTTAEAESGRAGEFDGADDYVSCGNAASLIISRHLIMDAWVKLHSYASGGGTTDRAGIVQKTLSYYMSVNSSTGKLDASLQTVTAGHVSSNATVPLDQWVHLAIAYDGNDVLWFINGNLDNTLSAPGTISDSGGNLVIGGEPGFGRHADGLIDEVRILNLRQNTEPDPCAADSEILELGALQFGTAAIELARALDYVSALRRISQWNGGSAASTLAALEARYDGRKADWDSLTDDYMAAFRIVIGLPQNGPLIPYTQEEWEKHIDPVQRLQCANDFLDAADALLSDVLFLKELAELILVGHGALLKSELAEQPLITGQELFSNAYADFAFGVMGPPFDGFDDINRRAEPLFEKVTSFRYAHYVQHTSSGPGQFVFDDTAVSLDLTNGEPLQLVAPAGVAEWRHVPSWFADAHAGDDSYLLWPQAAHASAWDIWNSEVQNAHLDYVQAVAQHYDGNPAVLKFKHVWEPTLGYDVNTMGGYTTAARNAFRQYLQDKYGTIGNLNSIWATTYGSFLEIEPPGPSEFNTITALCAEFRRFRYDGFSKFINDHYQVFRTHNQTHPVAADPSGGVFPTSESAVDLWDFFSNSSDIISNHTFNNFSLGDVFLYSINRYLNKTTGILEYYWHGANETWGNCDENLAGTAAIRNMWQITSHGRSLVAFYGLADTWQAWGEEPLYGVHIMDFYTDYTRLRRSAGELPVMAEKVRRLAQILRTVPIVEPETALFYPSSTLKNENDLYDTNSERGNTHTLHQIMYPDNYHYAIMPEEALLEGKDSLSNYKVIIAPAALYVPDQLNTDFEQWVNSGGVLIITGKQFGVFDELAQPSGDLLKAVFGASSIDYYRDGGNPDLWRYTWNGPPCAVPLEQLYGAGKIVMVCPLQTGDAFKSTLLGQLDAVVGREAWCQPDGDIKLVLRRDNDNAYLAAWNLSLTDTVTAQCSVTGEYPSAKDLGALGGYTFASSAAAGTTTFDLTLGPGEGTVIELGDPEPTTCQEVWQYGYGIKADFDHDCYVNWTDLALFAGGWLSCNDPNNENCTKTW